MAASSADGSYPPPPEATVVSPGPLPSLKGVVPDGAPLGSCLRLPFLTSEEAQEGLREIAYLGSCMWLKSHDSSQECLIKYQRPGGLSCLQDSCLQDVLCAPECSSGKSACFVPERLGSGGREEIGSKLVLQRCSLV